MKYSRRIQPAPPLRLDYAPRNRRRTSLGDRLSAILVLAVFGLCTYLLARQALAQAVTVELLCDENAACWERYCAQDMSCDGPAVQP